MKIVGINKKLDSLSLLIQSLKDKTGKNQNFKARSQRAAAKNEGKK